MWYATTAIFSMHLIQFDEAICILLKLIKEAWSDICSRYSVIRIKNATKY